jgi:hypothetical protein
MFVIYGLGWAAVFGCFAALYFHAAKQAAPHGFDADEVRFARDRAGHCLIVGSIGLASVVLAVLNVGVRFGGPGWVYMFIGPSLGAYWSWRRRSATTSPA